VYVVCIIVCGCVWVVAGVCCVCMHIYDVRMSLSSSPGNHKVVFKDEGTILR